jgi:tRNA modification GTPase
VNAGKSSLFNWFIGESRAIVTEIPGTTRDVLREPIVVDGVLFILQDTAGLRGTTDRVESIGIELAESAARESDVVLFVVKAGEPITDELVSRLGKLDHERTVLVLAMADLGIAVDEKAVRAAHPDLRVIYSSVPDRVGLDELKQALIECVGRDRINWVARERIVLNSRLTSLLKSARGQIDARARGPSGLRGGDGQTVQRRFAGFDFFALLHWQVTWNVITTSSSLAAGTPAAKLHWLRLAWDTARHS